MDLLRGGSPSRKNTEDDCVRLLIESILSLAILPKSFPNREPSDGSTSSEKTLVIRAKIEDEVGSAHARDGAPNPCFILLQIIAVISNCKIELHV